MAWQTSQTNKKPRTNSTNNKNKKNKSGGKKKLVLTIIILVVLIGVVIYLATQIDRKVSHIAPGSQGNTHVDEYMEANWNAELTRDVPYPARADFAVLRGSWNEMGQQYGQEFGEYIRIIYDAYYGIFSGSELDSSKLGGVLDSYKDETGKFSPEMVQFIEGIGEGAAPELNQADNADVMNNTQKVMFINSLFEVVIPPAWGHVAEMMGEEAPDTSAAKDWPDEPYASHSWAAWGDMTTNGNAVMGGTRDQPWLPNFYNVAYVAVPDDEDATTTWGNAIAGHVASSAQVNKHGVGVGNAIVSHSEQHFGVPTLISTGHISFFADSAKEAADMLTVGTPEYRQETGRETLASTVGFFQTFADKNEAYTVERTGRHYAVREAGTQDESGDYTVVPNHAVAAYSMDEDAQPTNQPMENWTTEPSESSLSRYWALYYELANNKGDINPAFGREHIATLKHTYTPDGEKITEEDGVPVWRLGLTPERWMIPEPADPNSLPIGGNNMYFVADLENLEIKWVQGIPSHWDGGWDSVSLRDKDWE